MDREAQMFRHHRFNRVVLVSFILLSPWLFGRCQDDPQEVVGGATTFASSIPIDPWSGIQGLLAWLFDGKHPLIAAMLLILILAITLTNLIGQGERDISP
jgi:hypothetical protein